MTSCVQLSKRPCLKCDEIMMHDEVGCIRCREHAVDAPLTRSLGNPMRRSHRRPPLIPTNTEVDFLAPRERQVFFLFAAGMDIEDVALRTHLTTTSVRTVRSSVSSKLSISMRFGRNVIEHPFAAYARAKNIKVLEVAA